MKQDEFVARVRDNGEYPDTEEADRVTHAVLAVLGTRLHEDEAKDLAAQLPGDLQEVVAAVSPRGSFGVEEFLERLTTELPATKETARWDASAVLTTLAQSVSGGQLNQILTQLQPGYAELFGKPDLT